MGLSGSTISISFTTFECFQGESHTLYKDILARWWPWPRWFRYEANLPWVLQGLSFSIQPGHDSESGQDLPSGDGKFSMKWALNII